MNTVTLALDDAEIQELLHVLSLTGPEKEREGLARAREPRGDPVKAPGAQRPAREGDGDTCSLRGGADRAA